MNRYLNFSPLYFFCLYSIIFIIFSFIANFIVYDDTIFYKTFENTIPDYRIASIIENQRFFQKIGYGLIPILLLLRITYTATCIIIGVLFFEKDLKFSHCFNIAIKTDVVFLIELIIKINYFSIVNANTLDEVNIRFFSVLQIIGVHNVEQWLFYPLGVLNIFEITYWILLAIFLSDCSKESFGKSLCFIAKTYGLGLLLWITFVMFIILNFS